MCSEEDTLFSNRNLQIFSHKETDRIGTSSQRLHLASTKHFLLILLRYIFFYLPRALI